MVSEHKQTSVREHKQSSVRGLLYLRPATILPRLVRPRPTPPHSKEAGDGLGCEYWEVWDSFSKFTKVEAEQKVW